MANSLVRIPLEGTESIVKLEIDDERSGSIVWELRYTSEDGTYYRGTHRSKCNTILLGGSDDLKGDTDIWTLIIASPREDDETGFIKLTWYEDGIERASWPMDLDTTNSRYEEMAYYPK